MTLKIAVLAPIASARIRIAVSVNPGERRKVRTACRTSNLTRNPPFSLPLRLRPRRLDPVHSRIRNRLPVMFVDVRNDPQVDAPHRGLLTEELRPVCPGRLR